MLSDRTLEVCLLSVLYVIRVHVTGMPDIRGHRAPSCALAWRSGVTLIFSEINYTIAVRECRAKEPCFNISSSLDIIQRARQGPMAHFTA